MNKHIEYFAGLNAGQFGDLVINTVAARAIKEKYPKSHFTLGIGKPFEAIAPLFLNNKYIDDVHIWESYDGLTGGDIDYIDFMQFDKVFDPMPQHKKNNWWNDVKNQTEEVCIMHDLKPPKDLSCSLTKWFKTNDRFYKYIAIFPFGGVYRGIDNEKCLTIKRAEQIIEIILSYGYKVLQVGGNNEPILKGALKLNTNYFESVKNILGCKMAIGVDTGLSWVMSGYEFPFLGLYSNQFYKDKISVIQPINKKAIYLDSYNVNNINLHDIEKSIRSILCQKI